MKAIESIKPVLAQLNRDELIQLATLALALAENQAAINSLFEHPSFQKLLDKDLQDIELGTKLIPFTLESLQSDFEALKHG